MVAFDSIAAGLVIVTLVYVSFALTAREWIIALGRGEAVTLLPERAGRRWPLWMQIGMLVLGLVLCVPWFYFLWIPLLAMPGSAAQILRIIGLVLYLLGLVFVLWARRELGRNWGISTSVQVKLLQDHRLVQSGPYAVVRHPMYLGWWVCMLGLTLLYPVWAVFLLFIFSLISFFRRARGEEAALSERFGAIWTEYRSRTSFLIPFIY